ncbi:MAG: hypothetical protein QOI10_2189 [Solirubrobacterales bacterium]|jgi:phage terminase small subunit|nr:hypothetical protein [Solirubrobacterales bacterium]
MTAKAKTHPPRGLGDAGKQLWTVIIGDIAEGWELDARELVLLERACRTADELAELEAIVDREGFTTTGSKGQTVVHPAVSEARQLRLVQLRLLGQLELADPLTSRRAATPAAARARRAAQARWRTERAAHG